jgi:hypothetical protein
LKAVAQKELALGWQADLQMSLPFHKESLKNIDFFETDRRELIK